MAASTTINERCLTRSEEETMNNLVQLFGSVLDFDIIQNVASYCNYDESVYNILSEMSSPTQTQPQPYWCEKKNQNSQNINNNPVLPKPSPTVQVQQTQMSKSEKEFQRIISDVRKGYKILVLMRGLPGSGKSSLAKKIVEKGVGLTDYYKFVFSADDYFINPMTGIYEYHPSKIKDAHDFNQDRTRRAMEKAVSPIVIDNTNTQIWEMKPYATLAIKFGYVIEVLEPLTSWKFNIKELSHKNTHNVPRVKIQDMYERYDEKVTAEALLQANGLSYINTPVRSKRSFPPIENIELDSECSESNTTRKPVFNNKLTFPNRATYEFLKSKVDGSNTNDSVVSNTPETNLDVPIKKSKSSVPFGISKKVMQLTCSDDNFNQNTTNNKKELPKLNLSSWGLAENSFSSWEVVSRVNLASESNQNNLERNNEVKHERETSDTMTNTSNMDFLLLTNSGCNSPDFTIKNGKSRDINEGIVTNLAQNLPKKVLLDKSSMVTDENLSLKHDSLDEKNIKELVSLFPDIPAVYLRDVYEKCEGDLNWAVDILLDDTKEFLPSYQTTQPKVENSGQPEVENLAQPETSERNESSESAVMIEFPQNDEGILSDTSNESSRSSFEENFAIKKFIEDNIVINEGHYSEHVLKLKNFRKNEALISPEEPSTSIDSPLLLDDFEVIDGEEEETMELNLAENVLSQLETKFGRLDMLSQGFQPVIQLPVRLAQHLHALYVESVFLQMENQNQVLDMIVKEDEEFAKKLQMEDAADLQMQTEATNRANGTDTETPNFRQIMEEQLLRQQQTEEWKKLTPDTLAAKLTMQKLMSLFPSLSKSVIEEMLHAHNNCYQETVKVLSTSIDRKDIYDPDGTMTQPPITETVVNEMKFAQMDSQSCMNVNDEQLTAEQYRDEAKMHLEKHNDLIAKAQQSLQRKQYAVAQFYSEMARTHTKHYEQANSMAATAFLQQHSSRLRKYNTIDLHYLYVKEALSALDVFIDREIMLLKECGQQKTDLFVITGRGKNSKDGKSKLKPAIQGRLKRRQIPCTHGNNPGVLKIRVYAHSLVTSDLT